MKTWREHFAPRIAAIIKRYPEDCPERKKAFRDAWDAGPRRYHPYKVYLDEIARQTKRKAPLRQNKRSPVHGQLRLEGVTP